jgi:hypothetical protein
LNRGHPLFYTTLGGAQRCFGNINKKPKPQALPFCRAAKQDLARSPRHLALLLDRAMVVPGYRAITTLAVRVLFSACCARFTSQCSPPCNLRAIADVNGGVRTPTEHAGFFDQASGRFTVEPVEA